MRRPVRSKLIAAVAVVALMLAAVPVIHAGLTWTGFDPELEVDGHTLNIWVEWPSENTCSIEDIDVEVRVPRGVSAELVAESTEAFDCPGGAVTLATETEIERTGGGKVRVVSSVDAEGDFPVRILIYKDGDLEVTCEGVSNSRVKCKGFRL